MIERFKKVEDAPNYMESETKVDQFGREIQDVPQFILEVAEVFQKPGTRELYLTECEYNVAGISRYDVYSSKPCIVDGIGGDSVGVKRGLGPSGLGASIASAISADFTREDSTETLRGGRKRLFHLLKSD